MKFPFRLSTCSWLCTDEQTGRPHDYRRRVLCGLGANFDKHQASTFEMISHDACFLLSHVHHGGQTWVKCNLIEISQCNWPGDKGRYGSCQLQIARVQVKLWDTLRTCAIPERFWGTWWFTKRCYVKCILPFLYSSLFTIEMVAQSI